MLPDGGRPMRWAVVVPVKRLAEAKSRLDGRTTAERARLALAFATDTINVVRRTAFVDLIVVVTDDPDVRRALEPIAVVVDEEPGPGLNSAVDAAAASVAAARPEVAVAVLVSDLPALRATDLAPALDKAAKHPCAFVADATGSGTTMLTAMPGRRLRAAFGPGSATRHATAGAVALEDSLPSLRHDVDTEADLLIAQQLGVGPATSRVLSPA